MGNACAKKTAATEPNSSILEAPGPAGEALKPASDKVLQRLTEVFKSIDADQSGTVSKVELTAKLNSDKDDFDLIKDGNFGKLVEDAGFNPRWHAFAGLDTKNDGRITWDEFEAHLRKGLPADDKVLKQLKSIFDGIDADQNGTVSKAELTTKLNSDKDEHGLIKDATFGKSVEEAGFNPLWHAFEDLDTNNDGRITWEEFEAHLRKGLPADDKVLKQLKNIFDGIDADHNGTVSKAELTAKLNSDKDEHGLIKDGTFGRLVEDAGLNPLWHAFADLDTNSDGRITWEEFEAHLRKGLSAPERILRQLKSVFDGIDANDDGTVSKAELTAKLNSDKDEHGLIKDATFGRLVEEAGFNPLWHAFEDLDTNNDGRITWVEFEANLRKATEKVSPDVLEVDDANKQTCGWFC